MILGRIHNFTKDIFTRKQLLTLEVEGDCSELIENLKDQRLSIDIKKYRKKRSLTANGYYWALNNKISEAMGVSGDWLHNKYLRECRYVATVDGDTIAVTIPDTDEAEEEVMQKRDYHLLPTNRYTDGKNGRLRYYLLLKGSSEFDSLQMARLIEFAVTDAKTLGIPTITETEQKKLIELYGIKGGKK